MFYADQIGLPKVLDIVRKYQRMEARNTGRRRRCWKTSPPPAIHSARSARREHDHEAEELRLRPLARRRRRRNVAAGCDDRRGRCPGLDRWRGFPRECSTTRAAWVGRRCASSRFISAPGWSNSWRSSSPSTKKSSTRLSYATGATKGDSWIDIDGGIGTLFVFASKGARELPDSRVYVDGAAEALSKTGTFIGQHICTSLEGAAVHINAFNFPVWGMLEKLAPTLIAGVPAIVKPATSTAYLTELVVRRIVESGILPAGSLQLLCGSAGDLFEHLDCQDAVAFTGSASTAASLRRHPNVIARSVRFTAETDSLNSSILGPGRGGRNAWSWICSCAKSCAR